MIAAMLLLFSLSSQYLAHPIWGNNITDLITFSQELEDQASYEDSFVAAGRRQARWLYATQKPFWAKINQDFIDVVNKTSNKFPIIPFVVNVMCDSCIDRMGKWGCCFFISWSCCTGRPIEAQE